MEAFGQFGGSACQESLGEREHCTTNETCARPPPVTCTDTEFQCESGTAAATKRIVSHCVTSGV